MAAPPADRLSRGSGSFLARGFRTVIIASNGFHTPAEGLNDMVGFLLTVGDVYHVTLVPTVEETRRRVAARGSDMTADAVADHVNWMRARHRPWTSCVDNTTLTPEATVAEIAARIDRRDGKVSGPLPNE